jgi:hypothetical protein
LGTIQQNFITEPLNKTSEVSNSCWTLFLDATMMAIEDKVKKTELMKDIWYADKRDMVKWGGLINLCRAKIIPTIMQVAYFRQEISPGLKFDGKIIPFPGEVHNFFRDLENIKALGKITGIRIKVFIEPFNNDSRIEYHRILIKKIKTLNNPKVIFLDPDNGVAPSFCKDEHVAPEEIADIWEALSPGDFLVLYQHLFRKPGWADLSRDKLAKACSVKLKEVHSWSSDLAHDVVFFYLEKQ